MIIILIFNRHLRANMYYLKMYLHIYFNIKVVNKKKTFRKRFYFPLFSFELYKKVKIEFYLLICIENL